MDLQEDNQLFSISSDSAILKYNGQQNSKLLFQIPNFIQTEETIDAIYFSVNSAVIPSSFWNVNATNNRISINNQIYLFYQGNYNVSQLLTMMNGSLPTGYYFEYDSITNLFQLFAPVLDWSIEPTKSSCYRLIGWNNTEDFIFSMRDQYQSPNVANMATIPRIFIRSSVINTQNYSDETGSFDVLSVIPNTACTNGMIHYTNYNNIAHLISRDITNFDIFLTDDDRNLIDFKGVPIYMTFNIKTLRRQVKTPSFRDMYITAQEDVIQMNQQRSLQAEVIQIDNKK